MADDRKRKGDSYPGITHPAVSAVACPTCKSPKGAPCRLVNFPRHTRTHRTRLNLWRVQQQEKGGKK